MPLTYGALYYSWDGWKPTKYAGTVQLLAFIYAEAPLPTRPDLHAQDTA